MLGRWRRDHRTIRVLVEAIEDLASDVSSLRAQVATLRGKQAVVARESKRRKLKDPELALLEEMTGGKVIAERSKDGQYTLPEAIEQEEQDGT